MNELETTNLQQKNVDQLVEPEQIVPELSLDDKIKEFIASASKKSIQTLKTTADLRFFEEYIKMVLAHINKDKNVEELEIFAVPTEIESHYAACRLVISNKNGIKKTDRTYDTFDKASSMRIEEVTKNCSTVSIHHIDNLVSNYYKGVLDTIEDGIVFLRAIVTYLKEVVWYSNILYTISSESTEVATEYCKRYATKIYEIKNRRNRHINTYYCESLV